MIHIEKLRVLELFSGIGAFTEAFKNLCISYEVVNFCEVDEVAAKSYSIIHNESLDKNLGDITKVNPYNIPDFEVMTYGFPCQDISMLGDMKGLTDENGNLTRSGLFFEAMKIAKCKKPKYMIAENVRALTFKKRKKDLEAMLELLDKLGYNNYLPKNKKGNYTGLNSKDYGIPHSRGRVYIVSIRKDIDDGSFEFPKPVPLTKSAKDFYEKEVVDDEYYLRESDMKYLSEFRLKKKYSSLNADIAICQTTKQGNLANPQNFIKDKKGYRIMTPGELLSLQGFKREYGQKLLDNGVKKEKIGSMSGNSITVNVLMEIYKKLFKDYIEL